MGCEIKRVPLDFDWPVGKVWPGFLRTICEETMEYCMGKKFGTEYDKLCDACRHFARLAGLPNADECPDSSIELPKGEGYQLWETVSEGSPVSPVFATPEELAEWLVSPGNDTSITEGTSREQWLAMIRGPGFAFSLVVDDKGVRPGVQI